ncbi:MAG: FAD-dependent oxidoreductase [Acutalibacteraceae bacterium]
MPEQNKEIISKYQGDKNPDKRYLKLGRKITDAMTHKIFGVTSDDPEYWGLREVLTPEMCDVANKMKLRKHYTFDQLLEMNREYEAIDLQKLLDEMAYIGILEYDYGDNYDHDHELKDRPRIRRYRLPFYVPGSAELFNSSVDRIEKNPAVTSFFERMTYLPLAGITQMVPPGGDGIGMHVIPVEKAIDAESQSVDLEHISYWLKKYEGHISAGICSCRASRAVLGDGCTDDFDDWCIQLGDMADYTVETGRAHYITKERALEILELAEKNGYVHQITNIDGENKIFDICNCNVKICNALRTSLLFNTPYLSRSSFTANVDKEKCVACGKCVETCPAGAVKMGQKLCRKDGSEVEYPHAPLPDNNIWGAYAWDEDYRDTARMSNTYPTGSAPCKAACPAHVPVQAYLRLAHEGKYREALAMIKTENPFPAVCGRVCNKRCESECTRGKIDAPVSIDAVKKYVADLELRSEDRYIPEKIVQSVHGAFDEKIAIIGGGPAGLSAAYYLAQMGYKPTVFEKNPVPGGMLTYGIPSYKLEKDVIAAEIDVIKAMGAEIKCGVEVGRDVTIPQLREQGYKAFYIAIGCQGGKRPGVKNDNATGTDIAVNYLRRSYEHRDETFGGDVVVIGGGNVAIDCARNAHRLGASGVKMFCLESRDEMPASRDEITEAEEESIEINPSWGPKEVLVDESGKVTGIVLKKCLRTIDPETKRFSPAYDEDETIEVKADKIVFAIGQDIEWGSLLEGSKVSFWHGNYPVADKFTYQTEDPDIFVGGDVYTGPRFVIDAIAAGHEAAESLHRHVRPKASMTIGRDRRSFTPLNKEDIQFPSYDEAGRQEAGMDESIDFKSSFADAHKTLTEEQVKIETGRCLGCGASYVDYNKCIGCGLCTTKCEFDAIHLVRDHPECTDMRIAEEKIGGLLSYSAKRAFKILGHLGSDEARELAKKRRDYKQAQKSKD